MAEVPQRATRIKLTLIIIQLFIYLFAYSLTQQPKRQFIEREMTQIKHIHTNKRQNNETCII